STRNGLRFPAPQKSPSAREPRAALDDIKNSKGNETGSVGRIRLRIGSSSSCWSVRPLGGQRGRSPQEGPSTGGESMQRAIGRVLVSLVALILFSGLCVAEAPQGDSGDAVPLRLKAGTFDPKAGLPAALRDVAPGPGAAILPAAADRGDLQIVQFNVAPGKAQQDLLAGLGIRVLDFIPERALAVRLVKGVSVDALRALPGG